MSRVSAFFGFLAALLAVPLLTGCANQASNPFAPASPLAGSVVAKWEQELAAVDLRDYRREPERSALVYRLLFISDYHFSRYEAKMMLGKAAGDTFIDMSMFGLNSAAALLTPGDATQVLSAISGGLSFSRNTIEKNFHMNQTTPVLIARMRALRKEKLNEIAANLRQSPRVYPIELAIIDVLDYYNRGTMLGALQSVSNETAAQEIRAAGGEVKRGRAAPSVRLLYAKTAPPVVESEIESLETTPQNAEFRSRRRALGSKVIALRKQADATSAVQILSAGGVTAAPDEAIRKLGDEVDSIGTRSELEKWESAFGAAAAELPKTPAAVIPDKIEPL